MRYPCTPDITSSILIAHNDWRPHSLPVSRRCETCAAWGVSYAAPMTLLGRKAQTVPMTDSVVEIVMMA